MPGERVEATAALGLVGLGKLVVNGIGPAIQRSDRAVIAACASRDVAEAKAFAKSFSVPGVHAHYEDLVRDPSVDAVFVATPNQLHTPVVLAAAAAGKPVLCEKPLAMTLAEGREMVVACRSAGVMLRIGLHLRFDRALDRIAAILRDGAIGRPIAVSIDRAAPVTEKHGWRLDVAQGGGVLFDVGVHMLDLIPRLLGTELETVAALASPDAASGLPDETLTMLCRLASGPQATIRVSRESPVNGSDLTVIGETGMLRTGPLRWVTEHEVTITTAAGARREVIASTDHYRAEIEAFAEDLADGRARLGTGEDGVYLITVADAVRRALRDRATVAFDRRATLGV